MNSNQKSMIIALEKALEDARSGRLIAFAFCGVGRNEHAICYAFDDEKPGEQMFLLGAIEKAQGEVRAAVTRYDYELGDDGVMFATPEWRRDNEATAMRLLACHSIDAPIDLVATWTDEQVKAADIWAWTSYLSASDHDDVQVPPRPDFIPDAPDRSHLHLITGEVL